MKKFVALCLSALLLTSSALGAQWPAWCEEARVWGEEASLSESFTSSPDTVMTRSMTARLFYELAGSPEEAGGEVFTDVSGPEAGAISWAAQVGLVKGVGEGRFGPDSPVTRQDFALMLYRWLGEPRAAAGGLSACTDREEVGPWAWEALNWCLRAGVMEGRGEGLLAPRDNVTTGEALLMARRAEELPDLKQMETDLETLTASPRPIGSQGEQAAAEYLKECFTELGYEVTLQPYADEKGNSGTNVIAVRAAEREDADILVLSAHHDSVPSAYGANDNASGVAALLYAAELLKDTPTDTELRFISFTDEENGKNGSRHYTSTLTEDEGERMVGDIQFDMLGGLGSQGTLVCTTDGRANWLSDALMEQDGSLALGAETASDHSAFQLAGVPAVLVMQNGRGYLYHSAADRVEELNLYAIARSARMAEAVVRAVASAGSPSYRETAHAQAQSYTYRQTRQNVIYFDSSLADTETCIGASGELVDHREVTGTGWSDSYDTYRYTMLWFDGDTPMNTYYEYRNGYLQSIEIRPFETGYTTAQVRDLLLAMYGQPTRTGTDRQGNPFEAWQDEIYSKYLTLTETADGCTVTVSKFSLGVSNVLADYPVTGGQADIDDPADKAVWDLVCAILPEESRQKIARFTLFTDGASNILAFTSPLTGEDGKSDNTRFAISIDYYDVYDETGAPRDWSKLIYTILHEYGHVLLEDETQIDLSQVSTTHDPAGFLEGSFRKAFYDAFWKDLGDSAVGDYEENPTHYVSRYGANYFHEDIADTFALFVLGGRPTGETVAGEKLNFFWADSDMVALRSAIRQNLALELKTAASAPAEPESPDGPAAVSDLTELQEELERAMAAVEQPPVFDVSALAGAESLELDAINCYNRILSQHPEYNYAYALTPRLEGESLTCEISYMPYRSGAWPQGFQGVEIGSLSSLMGAAEENLDKERFAIRITEPSLTVDDMNKALQQVGGGYLLCQLSRDGTAITVTAQNGLTQAEALDRLAEIEVLAKEVCGTCIAPSMTAGEKAQALYTYLTDTVKYDMRYYADRENLPYEATTAYGALHDHLAICGGYAQALQALFRQAGIPCYTVSGKLGVEYHMWITAKVDGAWLYFDPTNDRGRSQFGFRNFAVPAEELAGYTWDKAWIARLLVDKL